jgi:SulP family sulfate permease
LAITPEAFSRQFPAVHLPPEGFTALLAVLKPVVLKAGTRLVTQGERSDTLYFLLSGRLQITLNSDHTSLVLGELNPGRWVAEFGFIDPGPAAANVEATEDGTALALTQAGMNSLHEASPNTASALLQSLSLDLAERLRATSRHILEKNADNQYILRQPKDLQDVSWLSRIGRKLMGIGGNEQ